MMWVLVRRREVQGEVRWPRGGREFCAQRRAFLWNLCFDVNVHELISQIFYIHSIL